MVQERTTNSFGNCAREFASLGWLAAFATHVALLQQRRLGGYLLMSKVVAVVDQARHFFLDLSPE
jgi:hypothetical protein